MKINGLLAIPKFKLKNQQQNKLGSSNYKV
jgi:hypothetical protein